MGDVPYNNGVRIQVQAVNFTTNTFLPLSHVLDLVPSPSGTLEAYGSDLLSDLRPTLHFSYDTIISVQTNICYGYTSWSNSDSSTDFLIQNPQDIQCISLPFDPIIWNSSSYAHMSKGYIQAVAASWSNFDLFQGYSLWMSALPIILALQNYSVPVVQNFKPTMPRNPQCASLQGGDKAFAIAQGMIANHLTAMTALGLGLQALVVFTAALALLTLLWPTLPLIAEWPAQWIGLASILDRDIVANAVQETSVGQNKVHSDTAVFLASIP